jgi:hypothetical protein
MREQALIDQWSQLLVKWTKTHELAFNRQQTLDQKMTNHFVYDKAPPSHSEYQEVDALWQQEIEAREALDDFMEQHAID